MAPPLLDLVFSSRLLQQTFALTYKNALVAWRSRRATILRLMAPFVFLLLALIIQLALDANDKREGRVQQNAVSAPRLIPSIPDCNQDLFIGSRRCSTFVYSPNASSVVQEIIAGVKAANSPPIKDDKVIGFASRQDAEDYMLANPESTLGAVHFDVDDTTAVPKINYMIQSNSTVKAFKGNNQSPVTFFALPVQAAVSRAASKLLYGLSGKDPATFDWKPQMALFPHPQLRSIGMVGYVLGPFIFASCMFGLVTQLGAIVSEKETGLVTSLRHMGLLQSSYWLSWVLFDVLMGLATSLSIVMWGNILQFRFFLRNDAGILVLLFWLFLMALNSFSYFLSVFLSKQQSAVYMGFVIFLVGWIMQTIAIFGLPYDPRYFFTRTGRAFFRIFSCLPWCPLIKGTLDLAAATGSDKDPGIRWSQRSSYCQHIPDTTQQPAYDSTKTFIDFDCVYPLNEIYINLVIQAVVWLAIALYLDNVWPSGSGMTRPPWYFLMPSYWVSHQAGTVRHLRKTESIPSSADRRSSDNQRGAGTQAEPAPQGNVRLAAGLQGPPAGSSTSETTDASVAVVEPVGRTKSANGEEDEDVTAEANKMKALLRFRISGLGKAAGGFQPSAKRVRALQTAVAAADNSTLPTSELAVEVYGLSKVFKGPLGCGPNKGRIADFWAIKNSWFGIQEGQLFCLLGPNGAGKTTTINCLTGILAPTGGDMLVCGESVCTEGGLDRIRPKIGVCPQFDVLWGELTGLEHLVISGHVKGIPFSEVRQHASDLLNKVQLLSAADMRSGAYSGGMKRRLSVALALLGDPTVLYLDEPTTGMDPISRRYVWDVIQAAKPGRAIVLTTHSMEEADILGDRIAIMARGAIKAIGNSIRLKQKFGAGYQLIVTLKPDAKAPQQTPQDASTSQSSQQPGEPVSSAQLYPDEAGNSHVPLASRATRQAVADLVGRHLSGLRPTEEGKYSIRYAVPRNQQQQLIELLRVIEKGTAGDTTEAALAGIADVQLSLTSLEEVFLTIAKQAELEAASVTGATVSVHLPDSGKQVQVPVGQDWYEERQVTQSRNVQARYHIKWVQDDSGALTVLEVTPAKPRQHGGAVGSSPGSPRTGADSLSGLQGTSFRGVLAPVAP